MVWRLYDTVNSQWYNEELYDTRQACLEAADYYMQEAQSEGESLELLAEPLDPTEAMESLAEEEEEP